MAKASIRPEALAGGAAVFLIMAMLYNRASNRCTEFLGVWKEEGPIHLQQDIQDEAFWFAHAKIRSADASGDVVTVVKLRDYLLNYFVPKCEWPETGIASTRGGAVLQSFTDIARYSIDEFYKGELSGRT